MPAHQDLDVAVVSGVVLRHDVSKPLVVAFVRRLPRLAIAERRVFLGHLGETLQDEAQLDRHRLLAPERPVVVEDGDPFFRWEDMRRGFDELLDRSARRSVAPGGE
jgi:hypothetical protein